MGQNLPGPGNDGRCRRPPRSSRHHVRDERRELPPSRRARTQARPWTAAYPRDSHRTDLNDLLIGDVETVAEKLVGEIRATHPVHVCFSFKVGATPHKAAMRSMELMMAEVKPRVERAVGSPAREAAE